jgi:hypothetical protein
MMVTTHLLDLCEKSFRRDFPVISSPHRIIARNHPVLRYLLRKKIFTDFTQEENREILIHFRPVIIPGLVPMKEKYGGFIERYKINGGLGFRPLQS